MQVSSYHSVGITHYHLCPTHTLHTTLMVSTGFLKSFLRFFMMIDSFYFWRHFSFFFMRCIDDEHSVANFNIYDVMFPSSNYVTSQVVTDKRKKLFISNLKILLIPLTSEI